MNNLLQRVEEELLSNILPFWLDHAVDHENGGFYGQISNRMVVDLRAPKGLILNARILWTFSRAYRHYRDPVYLATAHRAYEYLVSYFLDHEFGGVYWMVDCLGRPHDTKKRIYGQAFTVYAMAEYSNACASSGALEVALRLVEQIESAGHDAEHGGYFETYERDWSLAADQRLSEVDLDEKKSMNTHLHLLEGYTALLRIHEDATVRLRLRELIDIFLDRILDGATNHFILFLDEQWRARSQTVSFGHDIEGSWLLCEAAEVLGDEDKLARVQAIAVKMAQAVYAEGLDDDGGLFYERAPGGHFNTDKHWWPQAEAVVGFLNAYEISGLYRFALAAKRSWEFIERYVVDREHGEWFWLVSRSGVPDEERDKVGPWKCSYHNSRTCFEAMQRLGTPKHAGLATQR